MLLLSPWFLPALAAAAAPVVLHLLNRRKRRVVPWAAMRFLTQTEGAPKRGISPRLKDLALLLLRVAAVAALVLFFARPLLPAGVAPEGGRDVILVLDASLSVSQLTPSGTAWKEGVEKAAAALENLNDADFVRILLAAETPQWLTPAALEATREGKSQASALLKAAAPGQGGCRLTEALAEAVTARSAGDGLSRRVVVFSDFQAESVRADAAAAWAGVRDAALSTPEGCVVEAVVSGPATTPPNLAVLRVDVSREQAAAGETLLFSARVRNTGPASSGMASLRWLAGDRPSGLSSVPPLKPGGEATVEITCPCPPEPGTVLFTAELEAPREDALPGDNAASALVETVEPPGVLLVDGSGAADAAMTDTAWIEAALGAASGEEIPEQAAFRLTVIPVQRLDAGAIGENKILILANPPSLPEPVLESLKDFVRNGGGLWLLPGDRTERAGESFAQAWAGISPLRWTRALGDPADEKQALKPRPPAAGHPVTRFLEDPRRTDFSSVRILRRFQFETPPPETRVLLALENGDPFLAERQAGEGRVLAQAAPFNLAWTTWPRHHAFVVLLHEGLWRLASQSLTRRNLAAGETLSWAAPPRFTEETFPLRKPDGQYGTVRRSRGRVMNSTDTARPGGYEIEAKGANAGELRFFVRRGEEESDLRPASMEEKAKVEAAGGVRFTDAPLRRNPARETEETRRPAWPLLAAAVAALLCLESLTAARLLRKPHDPFRPAGVARGGAA